MDTENTIPRESKYSRAEAVKYAITYALEHNPNYRYFPIVNNNSGNCANFISQCLFAGGAPMDLNPKRPWWYKKNANNVMRSTWSLSWTVAHSLYFYLKVNESINSSGVKGLEVYDKEQLELGDLIFYEDNKGVIFHSAIVTSFRGRNPLISQNSFDALNIPYLKTWSASKMHFIKIHI